MEQFKLLREEETKIFYSLKFNESDVIFIQDKNNNIFTPDVDSIAKAIGFDNAIEMMSNDYVLDILNQFRSIYGKWPLTGFLIVNNNKIQLI